MEPILEVEDPKVSLPELSKEEIINKSKSLIELCSSLQVQSDEKSQKIYDYKKELARLHTLEAEYIQEIESLQTEKLNECEQFKLKIQRLEGEFNDLNDQYAEQIEGFEQRIFKIDEEVCRLQDELQSLSIVPNLNNKTELDELRLMNTNFKNVIEDLENGITSLRNKTESLEKQHAADIEDTKNLEEEFRTIHESCKYKKETLNELKQLNETLQEELVLIKQELETIESKPLENRHQTNSLFAEVDDKRLELQEEMSIMKSQYLQMKSEHGKLLAKIAGLNSTNAMLTQRWETESQDRINDNDVVEEAYRERVKLLTSQHEICARVILNYQNIPTASLNAEEFQFLENMLEAKNKQMKKAVEQNSNFFLSRTILSCRLRDSKMEIRNWQRKVKKSELEMAKLQVQLEKLQSKAVLTESTETDYDLNMLDSSNTLENFPLKQRNRKFKNTCNNVNECNNEQVEKKDESFIDQPKRVGFADDVVEHTDANKSKLRKGCKIIHCKPMVLKKKC